MRVFKNKPFVRFARKAGLGDDDLTRAIRELKRGLVGAALGGGVVKQRIARPGGGKSGGFRVIILLRIGERAFFVHGFAKNDKGNIRDDELSAFKLLATEMLTYSDSAIAAALANGTLMEVTFDG